MKMKHHDRIYLCKANGFKCSFLQGRKGGSGKSCDRPKVAQLHGTAAETQAVSLRHNHCPPSTHAQRSHAPCLSHYERLCLQTTNPNCFGRVEGKWTDTGLSPSSPQLSLALNEIQGLLKWTEVLLKLRSSPMESSLDTT